MDPTTLFDDSFTDRAAKLRSQADRLREELEREHDTQSAEDGDDR